MDSLFKETFIKLCKEDLTSACLLALSVLSLRHISEEEKYNTIKSVLSNISISNSELDKVKEIYLTIESYDIKWISIMKDIEKDIVSILYSNVTKSNDNCNKGSKKSIIPEIKKWWKD